MSAKLKKLEEKYARFLYYDKPIPYKGLNIYPATMQDYIDFQWSSNCLTVDKNSIPDVNIIQMSYLEFIFYSSVAQENVGTIPYLQMLNVLLRIVLHKKESEDIRFYMDDNGNALIQIDGEVYNSDDFDNISQIIMLQNDIEPVDETIQKELRDEMAKAKEIRMQQSKKKMGSLEDQIICVLISTPLKLQDVYELTIRKFEKVLQRVDAKLHYQVYLTASMSGFVKFEDKDAIKHWMSDFTPTDYYEDVKVDMEEMKNKIDGVNR